MWKEDCFHPYSLHLQVQIAERAKEVTELKRNLAQAIRDKEQLQEVKQQIFGSWESKMTPPVDFYIWNTDNAFGV